LFKWRSNTSPDIISLTPSVSSRRLTGITHSLSSAFLHIENQNTFQNLKQENQIILTKISIIENDLKFLEEKESETVNLMEKLMQFEKNFDNFKAIGNEKDKLSKDLANQVKVLENKVADLEEMNIENEKAKIEASINL
jgi:small-conductance mechanosensitive channel